MPGMANPLTPYNTPYHLLQEASSVSATVAGLRPCSSVRRRVVDRRVKSLVLMSKS
jgi:hypothetical protein